METLVALGLSEEGPLQATGVRGHRERLAAGRVTSQELEQYARDLKTLCAATARGGGAVPIAFWDVRSQSMSALGLTEYALVHRLAGAEFAPYLELLGRAYGRLVRWKQTATGTAVATALEILGDCANYVRGGGSLQMTATRPHLRPEEAAILLWQQIVAGTTRSIHGREVYSHSFWGRHNVVEMWNFETGSEASVTEVWGLSGFAPRFVGDPRNRNQIEHMTISAVAQRTLHIPLFALNLLETVEWLTRRCSLGECHADQAVNRAVGRDLCRHFTLDAPEAACHRLEHTLASTSA